MLTLAGEVCGNILSTPNWAICFVLREVRQLVRIAGRVQNIWSRFYCHGVNQKKTGPKMVQHGACLTEGSKAIWAMPKYTDHFSKRGFPNIYLLFIGECNTVMLAIKKVRA